MTHEPVTTLEDLDSLDQDQIVKGYMECRKEDPEPGANSDRGYWHGWCRRAEDNGEREITPEHRILARAYLARERERYANGKISSLAERCRL